MIRLMNSAMMPAPGTYTLKKITRDQFCRHIIAANAFGELVSYIGYPQNAELIERWTGINVSVSRKKTVVNDGDHLLMMTVKYRVDGPKGEKLDENDFDFFIADYTIGGGS